MALSGAAVPAAHSVGYKSRQGGSRAGCCHLLSPSRVGSPWLPPSSWCWWRWEVTGVPLASSPGGGGGGRTGTPGWRGGGGMGTRGWGDGRTGGQAGRMAGSGAEQGQAPGAGGDGAWAPLGHTGTLVMGTLSRGPAHRPCTRSAVQAAVPEPCQGGPAYWCQDVATATQCHREQDCRDLWDSLDLVSISPAAPRP